MGSYAHRTLPWAFVNSKMAVVGSYVLHTQISLIVLLECVCVESTRCERNALCAVNLFIYGIVTENKRKKNP